MLLCKKLPLFICLLAVSVQAFRFEGQQAEAEEVSSAESIVPEENERNEKKIDPLVVDVDRRPVEAKEAKEESSEGEAEGRFFLKDKLCALGLADVSSWHQIQLTLHIILSLISWRANNDIIPLFSALMTKPSIKEEAKDTLVKITTMAKSNMSNL